MVKAIAILSAGVKKSTGGVWVNTDLNGKNNKLGAPGGKLRVAAAVILSKAEPDNFIIASGGRGYDIKTEDKQRPKLCEIARDELVKSGILKNKIILENKSNTTYQQLNELTKAMAKNKIKYLAIISNDYHLPRVRAMISQNSKLKKLMDISRLKLVSAEKVLLKNNNKKWRRIINKAYASKWMADRIKREKQGVNDLKRGKYKF